MTVHVLALDTSTPAITAGVARVTGGPAGSPAGALAGDANGDPTVEVLSEEVRVDPRAHAELITPLVLAALDAAGIEAADLGAVVVGSGPGPFTGLRVGMATAFAFAHALGIPVHGVCGLDAIAGRGRRAGLAGDTGELLVVTDARRREAYWATYDPSGRRIAGPAVDHAADIDTSGVTVAIGDETRLAELVGGGFSRHAEPWSPDVEGLVAPVAPDLVAGRVPERPQAAYLRRPDAVEPRPRALSPALVGREAGGPS